MTLVLDYKHGEPCRVAYAFSRRRRSEDVVCDLRCREGTVLRKIGRYFVNNPAETRWVGAHPDVQHAIADWARERSIPGVVWTGLESNFKELKDEEFSVDAARRHVVSLSATGKERAAEYVWRAPDFIDTPLRRELQSKTWFRNLLYDVGRTDQMGVGGRSPVSRKETQESDAHLQGKGLDVRQLVAHLSDPDRAEDPRTFPRDADAGDSAGLYSWWADSTAHKLFDEAGVSVGESCTTRSGQELALIYVGQTGATSRHARKRSSATLVDRVRNNHIGGNVKSSTFRETISAVLLGRLGLTVVQNRKLDQNDNERVSEWIKDHLRVSVVPFGDRDSLGQIERTVLREIDPPLNLKDRPSNPVRRRLEALRKVLRVG